MLGHWQTRHSPGLGRGSVGYKDTQLRAVGTLLEGTAEKELEAGTSDLLEVLHALLRLASFTEHHVLKLFHILACTSSLVLFYC